MSNLTSIRHFLRQVANCTHAGISVLATLALPVVVGAAGFGFDINRGYQQRIINQRAADMGALGAAMAYKNSSNTAILQPTAHDIAVANGLTGATVAATSVANYPTAGAAAVKVTVSNELEYSLARVLGFTGTYTVVAQSYATLSAAPPPFRGPCYLALSNGASALSLSGGATINAPACSVAAVGSILNNSTGITSSEIISGTGNIETTYGYLTANSLRYAGSFTVPTWNTSVPAANKRTKATTTLSDPWANDAARLAAIGLIGTYSAPVAIGNPTTPAGSNWTFNYSPSAPLSSWWNSSTKTYTVPAGNYTVGSIAVDGGIRVNFSNNSSITIANGFSNGGSGVNFRNSDVSVNGGFNSGSSGVTFGDGTLWIGSGTVSFNGTNTKGTGNVYINSTLNIGGGSSFTMGNGLHRFGRLTIGGGGFMKLGTGNFQANTGVFISGDSEFSMLAGNAVIGPHTDGQAINLDGSARMFLADGEFSANGHVDTEGGSKLVFGVTTNHYINGNFNVRGAALFGKGRYTINGNFINGTGGTTWPYTSTRNGLTYGSTLEGVSTSGYDMAGVDVSFFLNGTLNLAGGAKTLLYAATTSTGGAISELLLSSATTNATTWGAGSNSVFSGTVHVPNSSVSMSGGNSTTSSGRCFALVARTIAVTGGAATGSACNKMSDTFGGGATSTPIRLIG